MNFPLHIPAMLGQGFRPLHWWWRSTEMSGDDKLGLLCSCESLLQGWQ